MLLHRPFFLMPHVITSRSLATYYFRLDLRVITIRPANGSLVEEREKKTAVFIIVIRTFVTLILFRPLLNKLGSEKRIRSLQSFRSLLINFR